MENISMTNNSLDLFPDGTLISDWFFDTKIPTLVEMGKPYLITDYGVNNDGKVYSEKIQNIIATAFKNGGGVIVIPKGTYLSGALFFRQGVNLYVEEGGTLKSSDDITDFPVIKNQNRRRELQLLPCAY